MGTLITALVVFGAAGLVCRSMYRQHKLAKETGTPGCGCGCEGCSGCASFPKQDK